VVSTSLLHVVSGVGEGVVDDADSEEQISILILHVPDSPSLAPFSNLNTYEPLSGVVNDSRTIESETSSMTLLPEGDVTVTTGSFPSSVCAVTRTSAPF
jgi:hypothetical protein